MKISVLPHFQLEDDGVFPARLEYRSDDPWAVRLIMCPHEDDRHHWVFAPELLDGPMFQTMGEGDLKVTTCDQWVYLEMRNNGGAATLRAERRDVALFLESTHRSVPRRAELPDDLDIRHFMGGPR